MKKINIIIFIFILFSNLVTFKLQAQINNKIVAKVGEKLITSIDVQNEIMTNLIINKQAITQENINKNKIFAIKNLVNNAIKKIEINKYKITDYNKKDLKEYIIKVAENLNSSQNELKEIFNQADIDFEIFVDKYRTELTWNTLIYVLYKNQTNVNIVDIDNEVEKIKENYNDEELKNIKKNLLNKRKEEKLGLFSRSHFSNLENTISINFQ
jgi:hypothetical protein